MSLLLRIHILPPPPRGNFFPHQEFRHYIHFGHIFTCTSWKAAKYFCRQQIFYAAQKCKQRQSYILWQPGNHYHQTDLAEPSHHVTPSAFRQLAGQIVGAAILPRYSPRPQRPPPPPWAAVERPRGGVSAPCLAPPGGRVVRGADRAAGGAGPGTALQPEAALPAAEAGLSAARPPCGPATPPPEQLLSGGDPLSVLFDCQGSGSCQTPCCINPAAVWLGHRSQIFFKVL